MKWSRYNHLFECQYGNFIYNAVINSFLKISPTLASQFKETKDWDSQTRELDLSIREILQTNRIIVPDDFDDQYLTKLKFVHQKSAFANSHLALTIATTTACNFQCPYCYEEGIEHDTMNQETENAIINYINLIEPRRLYITWYGGEPLLNFPSIVRLTKNFSKLNFLKHLEYEIVTNGSLLTEETCHFFAAHNLKSIQITIDGLAEHHNKSRIMKNGQASFELILHNLDRAIDLLPNCRFSIRVNISYENRQDYPTLYQELNSRYKGKRNFSMYFTFVEDYNSCGENTSLGSQERIQFLQELVNTHHIYEKLYPQRQHALCVACHINDFVIAPNGDLYKCWSEIGRKDFIVGNIKQSKRIGNYDLICDYAINYNKFNDPKCLACFLLPICVGGCPSNRYNNKLRGTHLEICPYKLEHIDSVLELMYAKMHSDSLNKK